MLKAMMMYLSEDPENLIREDLPFKLSSESLDYRIVSDSETTRLPLRRRRCTSCFSGTKRFNLHGNSDAPGCDSHSWYVCACWIKYYRMFANQDKPYTAQPPVRVKCVAKYNSTRADSYETVDGAVAITSLQKLAACALSDGEVCIVAHLKNDDCCRLEEGQSYFIKHYNLTGRCGQRKLFFSPSTVVFKTSAVAVSSALEIIGRHAVCPPSKMYEEPASVEGYYTVEGDVIRLSATYLQPTRAGLIPVQDVTLQSAGLQTDVSLWREAALNSMVLGERTVITHLRAKKGGKFTSTSYTEIKKMEIAKVMVEVEVVGISVKVDTQETVLLTATMEELTVPAAVWSGDVDAVAEVLPLKVSLTAEGGTVCAIENLVIDCFTCDVFKSHIAILCCLQAASCTAGQLPWSDDYLKKQFFQLKAGDALYTRVKRALLNEGRYVSDLLTFDELPGTVETDSRCYSVIKHRQRFGFLRDEAPQGMAEYETLARALSCLTGDAPTALLLTGPVCIAVFRDRAGRFGFFDPHCRTPDGLTAAEHMGTAVMLTFTNLEDLIDRLLILYQACLKLSDGQQYDLLPVSFQNRDTATTADTQGKPSCEIQTIVDPSSSLRSDLCQSVEQSMAKLNKTRRMRQYLRQKHAKKKEQSIQTEKKKTGINRKNRYASDPKFREKMKQCSRVNYTENVISLPKGQQRAIKGAVVSVPSDVETTLNVLPRPRSESQLLTVKLKRRLCYTGHYQFQTISMQKVLSALLKLKEVHSEYRDIVINNVEPDELFDDPVNDDDDAPVDPENNTGREDTPQQNPESESTEQQAGLSLDTSSTTRPRSAFVVI
ncbi:hypothetical protein MHYP_G00018810 [Metynnis hypsauchen]